VFIATTLGVLPLLAPASLPRGDLRVFLLGGLLCFQDAAILLRPAPLGVTSVALLPAARSRLAGLGVGAAARRVEAGDRAFVRATYARLHGRLDKRNSAQRRRLEDLLRHAHVLLVPSRAESCGTVFAEAAAFGVPSLTTAVGGIPTAVPTFPVLVSKASAA
jgi:glycosyltransferase involved in cell wall biosynthesis